MLEINPHPVWVLSYKPDCICARAQFMLSGILCDHKCLPAFDESDQHPWLHVNKLGLHHLYSGLQAGFVYRPRLTKISAMIVYAYE